MTHFEPPCVLLVEDNEDARCAFETVLQTAGFGVVSAGDGEEALEHLRHGLEPRLILLDLMMPRKDGYEFRAEQMGNPIFAKFPVVLLSGAGHIDQKSRQLGIQDYLEKPVEVAQLLEIVHRYCGS